MKVKWICSFCNKVEEKEEEWCLSKDVKIWHICSNCQKNPVYHFDAPIVDYAIPFIEPREP